MTSSYRTVLDEIDLPAIPAGMLAGMNRRRRSDKLHESINQEYYHKADGWVTVAEGHETLQAQAYIARKGYTRIKGSPRPSVNAEAAAPWHALLRSKDGPAAFPVEQIIAYRWHKNSPVIFVCRQPLDELDHPEHTDECFARIRFPQLRGVEIEEASCGTCRAFFASVVGLGMPAEMQLRKHMEVSHTRMMQNNDLVNGLATALSKVAVPQAQGGATELSPTMVGQIAAIVAAVLNQNTPQPTPGIIPNVEPVGDEVDEAMEEVTTTLNGSLNDPAEPVSIKVNRKPLRDYNTAELEAYAAERDISLEGCSTNAQRVEAIRAAQAPPA